MNHWVSLGVIIKQAMIMVPVLLIVAFPIQWVWNVAVAPTVTVIEPVSYWQALGILWIIRLSAK